MNIHIEFVKEYLTNNGCKTQKELDDNADLADDAYRASLARLASRDYLDYLGFRASLASLAYFASLARLDASWGASRAAATGNVQGASKWVKEYEGLTK